MRVTVPEDCIALYEEEFCEAIRDNYFSHEKFHFDLSEKQVGSGVLLSACPLLMCGKCKFKWFGYVEIYGRCAISPVCLEESTAPI